MPKQQVYCFVDETGQDAGSEIFIVVAAITMGTPDKYKELLLKLESETKFGRLKRHKARQTNRLKFLDELLSQPLAGFDLFYGKFRKPLPYFFPTLETVEKSVAAIKPEKTKQVILYIDGLDKRSAKKYTNALRSKHLSIRLAKGARDEVSP